KKINANSISNLKNTKLRVVFTSRDRLVQGLCSRLLLLKPVGLPYSGDVQPLYQKLLYLIWCTGCWTSSHRPGGPEQEYKVSPRARGIQFSPPVIRVCF